MTVHLLTAGIAWRGSAIECGNARQPLGLAGILAGGAFGATALLGLTILRRHYVVLPKEQGLKDVLSAYARK